MGLFDVFDISINCLSSQPPGLPLIPFIIQKMFRFISIFIDVFCHFSAWHFVSTNHVC